LRIELLDEAEEDLLDAYYFYEKQKPALGQYFLDTLFSEIDSLVLHAGVHAKASGFYRMLSKRFPYAVYYRLSADRVKVYAILDCRRSPEAIRERLQHE